MPTPYRASMLVCWVMLMLASRPSCAVVADDAAPGETRDVLLLLESGPRHLRLHLAMVGRPLSELQNEYVDQLIATLDTNGDGKLTREEASRSPLRPPSSKRSNNQFVTTLGPPAMITRKDIARDLQRINSDTVIYREDESAARNDDEIFKLLDRDESGQIEREEMRNAFLRVLSRDSDGDKCITFDEFLPERPQSPFLNLTQADADDQKAPRPALSDLMRDTRQPTLPLRLFKQYDRDQDRYLTGAELGWDEARTGMLDANGDGRLEQHELTQAGLARLPVDLELAAELSGRGDMPALRVLSKDHSSADAASRPDLIRFELGDVKLSFSFRKVDPVAQAVATAMQQFNLMDTDANGYLDRMEVSERFRFQRGLFADMDRDGDDKVFSEEMRQYVAARAEPAASSCQVNVYNTGNGFFQMLDINGDGRISMRELRRLEQTLLMAASRSGGSLAPSQNGRHYHIEFVRATYQLFGPADGMVARRPEFIQRPPVGPEWFQAWDRNGDGDLTWSEFLGPRRAFDELDTDHDGLIDYVEAERATPAKSRSVQNSDSTAQARNDEP